MIKRPVELCIYLGILFYYLLIGVDNCTQGSIDGYIILAMKILILFIVLLIEKWMYRKRKVFKSVIEYLIDAGIIAVLFYKSIPYFVNTAIKNITLCQGSYDWGGFGNRYNFKTLPMTKSVFERYIAVFLILIPTVLIFYSVYEIIVYRHTKQEHTASGSCLRYAGSDYSPGELRAPGWNHEVLDNE